MDGRNSSGRTVSLLNDYCEAAVVAPRSNAPAKLPSLSQTRPALHHHHHHHHYHHHHSESPSEASTPALSPQTPPLTRSDSSDSRAFGSPSPLTPQSSSLDAGKYRPWPTKMDEHHSLYPPIADVAPMGYSLPPMNSMPIPPMRSPDSPNSDSRVSNVSAASAAAPSKHGAKKSQYPCPLAKQFKCNDFFTTSGHAARHAKKHTGRKDAICPECNKAFTRKDNMEQHRRTHQNVRGPSKAAADTNRVKKPVKQMSRKDRSSISGPLEAAVSAQLDDRHPQMAQVDDFPVMPNSHLPQPTVMPGSSGPYFMSAEPVAALPHPVNDYSSRPPLYRSGLTGLAPLDFNSAVAPSLTDPELHFTYPSPGLSNGLNTLALVASDHRRMSEEASSAKSTASTTP